MVKVKAELGLTLKMASGGGYNFFRPLISIEDIDPEGDVEEQVAVAIKALDSVIWDAVEQKMVQIVETSEVVEYESVLIELRKDMTDMRERISTTEQAMQSLSPADELNWAPKTPAKRKKT